MSNFKVISETDIVETKSLIAVIYGEPGVGKTSVSFTTENPVLLDFDGGLHRSKGRKTAVRVSNWEGVNEFLLSKQFKTLNPKTVVIDTAGTMLDNYIADYVKRIDRKNSRRGGELSLQGYGAMKMVFNQFVNWAKTQGRNIIFIAHAEGFKNGDDVQFRPELTGGAYNILRQSSDLIGFMHSSTKGLVIDFSPSPSHIGKDCAEIGTVSVPHFSKAEYKSFLQDLINKTLDKMNNLSEEQVVIKKMIDEYAEDIKDIETAEDANVQIQVIAENEKAIAVEMFEILKKECESKGIIYNRKTKKFEKE